MMNQEDRDYLEQAYVPRHELNSIVERIEARQSKDNARLAVIESQLKLMTWLLGAVGGGIIAMLVKMFFGG